MAQNASTVERDGSMRKRTTLPEEVKLDKMMSSYWVRSEWLAKYLIPSASRMLRCMIRDVERVGSS